MPDLPDKDRFINDLTTKGGFKVAFGELHDYLVAATGDSALIVKNTFTSTAGQTVYTGIDDNGVLLSFTDGAIVSVALNGVELVEEVDYEAADDGLSITLTTGAEEAHILSSVAFKAVSITEANASLLNSQPGTYFLNRRNHTGTDIPFNVATVDDMIADVNLVEGDWVETKGYYSAGDGGHAQYLISVTDDDSQNLILNNGLYAVIQITGDAVPAQFGVIFDAVIGTDVDGDPVFVSGTDNSAGLQAVIDYADSHNIGVALQGGDCALQSEVVMPKDMRMHGAGRKTTRFICGTAHSDSVIKFQGRCLLENFLVYTVSKYGMMVTSEGGVDYHFMPILRDIEIRSTAPGVAMDSTLSEVEAGPAAIALIDPSHVSMDSCNVSGHNIGCLVQGPYLNTGVMTFTNCLFGNKYTDNIGFFFASGSALDAFTFNACFFGGMVAAENVGMGNNNVTNVTHLSCHYESYGTEANAALVNIEGGSGFGAHAMTWINPTFGGHALCNNGIRFSDIGYFRGLSFLYPRFQNINENGYAIELGSGTFFKDCTLDGYSTITTHPTPFNNESRLFTESGAWFGGWMVRRDGTFETFNALEIGDHCRISSKPNDAQFFHDYTQGDIFINEGVTAAGNKSNVGWVAIGDGGDEVMKPFGLVREKPAGAAPTSGDYLRGAVVYNINPSAGGYLGWVCVSSGNPGTWKGFGLIEA